MSVELHALKLISTVLSFRMRQLDFISELYIGSLFAEFFLASFSAYLEIDLSKKHRKKQFP